MPDWMTGHVLHQDGLGRVGPLLLLVQQLKGALGGGEGGLEGVDHIGGLGEGLGGLVDILEEGLDHAHRHGAVQHGLRAAVIVDHGADGSMHDEKGDGGGKSGNFLFLLRHADGHAHGENDGKVGEYDVARGA